MPNHLSKNYFRVSKKCCCCCFCCCM